MPAPTNPETTHPPPGLTANKPQQLNSAKQRMQYPSSRKSLCTLVFDVHATWEHVVAHMCGFILMMRTNIWQSTDSAQHQRERNKSSSLTCVTPQHCNVTVCQHTVDVNRPTHPRRPKAAPTPAQTTAATCCCAQRRTGCTTRIACSSIINRAALALAACCNTKIILRPNPQQSHTHHNAT